MAGSSRIDRFTLQERGIALTRFVRGWRLSRREIRKLSPGVVGLAAGVAVMVATLSGVGAIEQTARAGVDALGGFGQVGIVPADNGALLTGADVSAIERLDGVAMAVPTLSMRTTIRSQKATLARTVMVTGYPPALNDRVAGAAEEGRLPRDGVREMLLPRDIADSLKAGVGDSVTIATSSGAATFSVVGVADQKALGVLAIDNVFTSTSVVQRAFDQAGHYTRIDLMLSTPVEEWEQAHSTELPAGTKLQDTSALTTTLEPILKTLRFVLMGLAVVLLVFSSLLGSAAYSDVVVGRRRSYSTLRAVGATRAWIVRSLIVESLLVSAGAVAIGSLVGVLGAWCMQALLGPLAGAEPVFAVPSVSDLLLVASLGFVGGIVSAARAASQLWRLEPIVALTQRVVRRRRSSGWLLAAGGLTTLALVALLWRSLLVDVVAVFVLIVLAGLAGVIFLPPIAKIASARWTRALSQRRMTQRGGIEPITIMTGAVVAVIVALLSAASAISAATTAQIARQFGADIQVSSSVAQDSDRIGSKLRTIPGVQHVATLIAGTVSITTASFVGECALLASAPQDYFVGADFSWQGVPGDRAIARIERGGAVALPAVLAENAGVETGDTITLSYRGRSLSLEVAGTFGAMITGNQIFLSASDARKLGIEAVSGWNVTTTPEADIEDVRARVAAATSSLPGVSAISAAQMRDRAAAQLLGYTGTVFVVAGVLTVFVCIAASVAFVANQRKRSEETAILHAVGAPPRIGAILATSDALNIGLAAALAGLICGTVAGFFSTRLIAALLNATLAWNPPLFGSVLVGAGVVVALQIAALASIRNARTFQPLVALRAEEM